MADPFQPKFAELVRNFTATAGTGNLVLGDAAPGFTSFASALKPGDRFYYSVMGLDKIDESEVGRGTLQADGTIAREPMSGVLTNFSGGSKTVALVAAAEWFDAIEEIRGAPTAASDRAALAGLATGHAAYLTEAGRQGLFVFDPGDLSAKVAADSAQGVYVAPSTDTTGVSGAWVRKFDETINVKWFGAKGDSNDTASVGTDDTAAIQAALNYVNAVGGGTLYFPEGYYKISAYLTILRNTAMVGAGRTSTKLVCSHAGGGGATAAENVRNGSAIYSGNPINGNSPIHIEIAHIGFKNTNAANVGAGFYDQGGTFIHVHQCRFEGFKYGVVLDQSELADLDLCDFRLQNANGACVWLVNGTALNPSATSGFTNRISVSHCQINGPATVNGILDDGGYTHAFTDNNYNGCRNHIKMAGTSAFNIRGGEFEAPTNATIEMGAISSSGQGVGGCYGAIAGCMLAAGSAPYNINILAASDLSVRDCQPSGTATFISGAANARLTISGNKPNAGNAANITDSQRGKHRDDRLRSALLTNFSLSALTLNVDYVPAFLRCTRTSAQTVTIPDDTAMPVPVGTVTWFEQSTAAGVVTIAAGAGVTLTGTLATAGQYQVIEALKIAANSWQCKLLTTGYTSNGSGVGYAPGAGGAVTQATSKTTGVTLNKACGQITLNAAALAADATVSFPLTNSMIAAGDVLILNHVSGGTLGAYVLNAAAAAGSATIHVRNISAASLSEAIVIGFAVVKAVTA